MIHQLSYFCLYLNYIIKSKTQLYTSSARPCWQVIERISSHQLITPSSLLCHLYNDKRIAFGFLPPFLLSVSTNIKMQICCLNFTILHRAHSSPLTCSFTCGGLPCITRVILKANINQFYAVVSPAAPCNTCGVSARTDVGRRTLCCCCCCANSRDDNWGGAEPRRCLCINKLHHPGGGAVTHSGGGGGGVPLNSDIMTLLRKYSACFRLFFRQY